MIKKILITFCIALINTAFATPKTYGNFTVEHLISVYDGDTIKVDIANCKQPLLCKNIGIRIFGIDTPEIRGKCQNEKRLAKIARDKVREVLKSAKIISLKNTSRGKYFRIVAQVFADNVEVADLLIEKKLAFRYFGGKKQSWCDISKTKSTSAKY
ncbi:MAG: thermonuclease family protein [Candidatus Thioglobus sp.]|nr:MAG: thermonuclease family protein [Candidatus Thioglobus sp.]